MKKILVLRGGALGDFIVTLPALALLRQRWPSAHIELVGNATAATLGLDAGLLNRIHSQHESRWTALYAPPPLPPVLAHALASFDLVLNFWPDPQHDLAAHFPVRSDQIFLSGTALPSLAPAAAHYCAPLRALGLSPDTTWFHLATPATAARLIAVHPGSGSPLKNWPLSRWVELCTWLRATRHAELLLITGEADSAAASALAGFGTAAHQLPLRSLVAHLSNARFFLGHDSGISHLAAACSLPSLLLFGPTDPAMWAPPAPHVRVLHHGAPLDSLNLAAVQSAVSAALADRD